MSAFPHPLLRRLGPDDAAAVQAWWDGLSETERDDLLARWDRRANTCRFAAGVARPDEGDRLPVRVGVRFLPDADPRPDPPEWYAGYLEHLHNHPEVVVLGEPVVVRTFRICTAHPAARAAVAAGVIPADFACPLAADGCPMRRLLAEAPGRDARLAPDGASHVGEERLP